MYESLCIVFMIGYSIVPITQLCKFSQPEPFLFTWLYNSRWVIWVIKFTDPCFIILMTRQSLACFFPPCERRLSFKKPRMTKRVSFFQTNQNISDHYNYQRADIDVIKYTSWKTKIYPRVDRRFGITPCVYGRILHSAVNGNFISYKYFKI